MSVDEHPHDSAKRSPANDDEGWEQVLTPREEQLLRDEVRNRLEAQEVESVVRAPQQTPARASHEQMERRRIIREEEDRFFAERGLRRYRNHRGEVEWLSEEDIRRRKQRRGSRRRRSWWKRLKRYIADRSLSNVVSGLVVLSIFTTAGYLILRRTTDAAARQFRVEVRSIPPGLSLIHI